MATISLQSRLLAQGLSCRAPDEVDTAAKVSGLHWERAMKIVGIVLIALGVIALAYGGISYTREKKVLDIGPIQATQKTHETIPLPPVLGVVAIVGGVVLLATAGRKV
jgi:uncharacterized membrane protein YidH (DUF202 family)